MNSIYTRDIQAEFPQSDVSGGSAVPFVIPDANEGRTILAPILGLAQKSVVALAVLTSTATMAPHPWPNASKGELSVPSVPFYATDERRISLAQARKNALAALYEAEAERAQSIAQEAALSMPLE